MLGGDVTVLPSFDSTLFNLTGKQPGFPPPFFVYRCIMKHIYSIHY